MVEYWLHLSTFSSSSCWTICVSHQADESSLSGAHDHDDAAWIAGGTSKVTEEVCRVVHKKAFHQLCRTSEEEATCMV